MISAQTNALVVGAGRFGRHYVRILARLNKRDCSNLPRIAKLIVTRTSLTGARDVVHAIETDLQTSVESIIPAKVSDARDLEALLQRYRPGFIAIVARDPKAGDSIHHDYARLALSYGAVLCEKPFMPASGDGVSLAAVQSISAQAYPHPLGLELPMAAVAKHLQKVPQIAEAINQANRIRFHWEAAVRGTVNLVDDLVLHPWSLLPTEVDTRVAHIQKRNNRADIRLQLAHRRHGNRLACSIVLVKGGLLRCMSLDRMTLVFRTDTSWVRVFQLDGHLKEPAAVASRLTSAREVLAIDNPLEQHIVAMLQRRPIVGLDRISQSQQLLERLHGYSPVG